MLFTQSGREGYKVSSHLLVWAVAGQTMAAGKWHPTLWCCFSVCQPAQLEVGITCIQIQQMLLPTIIGHKIRSQVVLQVLLKPLLLILLSRPCCYSGLPALKWLPHVICPCAFVHSLAWRHPSGSSCACFGCPSTSSFLVLLPLPATSCSWLLSSI